MSYHQRVIPHHHRRRRPLQLRRDLNNAVSQTRHQFYSLNQHPQALYDPTTSNQRQMIHSPLKQTGSRLGHIPSTLIRSLSSYISVYSQVKGCILIKVVPG